MAYTEKIMAIFESTNMVSTHGGARIFDVVADKDVENGTFGVIERTDNGLNPKFKIGNTANGILVVADGVCVDEKINRRTQYAREHFVNEQGVIFRARQVKVGDEFTVSAKAFDESHKTVAQEGKKTVAVIGNDGKLQLKDSDTVTNSDGHWGDGDGATSDFYAVLVDVRKQVGLGKPVELYQFRVMAI